MRASASFLRCHSEKMAGRQEEMERERHGMAQQAKERQRQRQEEEVAAAAVAAAAAAGQNGQGFGVRGLWQAVGVVGGGGGNGRVADEAAACGIHGDAAAAAGGAAFTSSRSVFDSQDPKAPSGSSGGTSGSPMGFQFPNASEDERRRSNLLYSSSSFYAASVWARLALAAAFVALVLMGRCEPGLLLLAGVNALGAVSMAMALKRQWLMHTMGTSG